MSERTAAIIGSTGMIGSYVLELILKDSFFSTVRLLVRRPQPKTHSKIEVRLVDFNDAESFKLALEETDTIFSCIGTTQKKVKGDKNLYRKIDFDIPLKAARFGKEAGCEKFILVSSVGADADSRNFYLHLKGELENAINIIGIESVDIMQPSVLFGDRKENRPSEKVLQVAMKMLSGIFAGPLKKYKAIHGKTVAAAMLNAAKKNRKGLRRYTYSEIKQLANNS